MEKGNTKNVEKKQRPPLVGKFTVKHFLNERMAPRFDSYPIYLLLRFQNKKVTIKSRMRFFHEEAIAPLSPLHVVKKYKEQDQYLNEKEFKVYEWLRKREAEKLVLVGEHFASLGINIVEHEPSSIIDISITPLHDLISDIYMPKLIELLNKKGYSYTSFSYKFNSNNDFFVAILSLREISSKKVFTDVLNLFESAFKLQKNIGNTVRIIDWISNDELRVKISTQISKECGANFLSEFQLLMKNAILNYYTPLGIPAVSSTL